MWNLAILLLIITLGSVSAYYTVYSDLDSFKTVDNISNEAIDNNIQTTLSDLIKTLIYRKSANYQQPSSNHKSLATNDDKKVLSDLFSSLVDKKAGTSELIMVVNAAESDKIKENLASDNDKAIKDLIKLLVDKKEANAEETLNFVISESDTAINDPKVGNFEILALNHQDLAISDDKKIFNKVMAALSNGETHIEEPASDYQNLAAIDDDDGDVIIVVNVAKSANPAIVEGNTDISTINNLIETFVDAKAADLDKKPSKDDEDVKNKVSSVKLITNNDDDDDEDDDDDDDDDEERAVNDLLKALVSPKIANFQEPDLDLQNLILNDDVKSMGDFVETINVLKIANLQGNPTDNTKQITSKKENIIDDNFKKLSSFEYYPDIIKDLGNDLKVASDQEKGDYNLDKDFFYDIDEPVGYEYYPVVAEKVDDKKSSKIVSFFCQHIMFIKSYC
ncbi:protein ecdysoneless homolog [Cotesia glomerata]|uniref:protein ecdysoneless homolog n=1 Tax=Cotesia glomerata TaxID=32391 RepID=UPI001D0112A1|nr:protein ecdysoneless homolog [Cotesia glomerata]